jgi:hypothetical protein
MVTSEHVWENHVMYDVAIRVPKSVSDPLALPLDPLSMLPDARSDE